MRAQASVEYIMVIGFVSFAILGVLVLAYLYANSATDSIKQNELGNMIDKIIATSEYVFYSGYPAQATILVYVPEGLENMQVDNNDQIIITYSSSTGKNIVSFSSNVKVKLPEDISNLITKGAKRLKIIAEEDENSVTVSLI